MAVRTFVPVRDEAADRELLRRIPDRHVQPIDLDVALVHHRSPCHVLLDLSPRPAHTGPLHQPIPHATPVPCRAYSSRLGHRCQTYPTATTHLVAEGLRVDLMDARRQGDAELDLLGPSWNGLALGLQRGGVQREGMEVSGEQERGAAAPQRRRGPRSAPRSARLTPPAAPSPHRLAREGAARREGEQQRGRAARALRGKGSGGEATPPYRRQGWCPCLEEYSLSA